MLAPLTPLRYPKNYDGSPRYARAGDVDNTVSWSCYKTDCGRFGLQHNRSQKAWQLYATLNDSVLGTHLIWQVWLRYVGLDTLVRFPTRSATIDTLHQMLSLDGLLHQRNPSSALPDSILQELVTNDWFRDVAAVKAA